jgi:hypothetical protein
MKSPDMFENYLVRLMEMLIGLPRHEALYFIRTSGADRIIKQRCVGQYQNFSLRINHRTRVCTLEVGDVAVIASP